MPDVRTASGPGLRGVPVRIKPLLIGILLLLPPFAFYRLLFFFKAPYRQSFPDEFPSLMTAVLSMASPVIPSMAVAGILLLIYHEWRFARLSHALWALRERKLLATGLLAAVFLAASSNFLLPGFPVVGESIRKLTEGWHIFEAVRDGRPAIWSNYGGLGYPLGQFRGPLYHYTVTGVMYLAGDIFTSTKIVLTGYHVLAGLTMFAFVRRWRGSSWAGIVSGLGLVLSFYHYKRIVNLGELPVSPLFALIPLPLLAIESLCQDRPARLSTVGLLGLSVPALMWTHIAYGSLAVGLIVLYGVLRILLMEGGQPSPSPAIK